MIMPNNADGDCPVQDEKAVTEASIVSGWERALKDFQLLPLSDAEKSAFERMAASERASKECIFCLPPCKDFPKCKCGIHNQKTYAKHGL